MTIKATAVLLLLLVSLREGWSAQTEVLTFYIFSDYTRLLTIPTEFESSDLALGRSFTTSETLYENINDNMSPAGTLLLTCITTHLDISDPNYQRVTRNISNYLDNHSRKLSNTDYSLDGRGAFQCVSTYSLSKGTITTIGVLESRRDNNATFVWAITGGTDSYRIVGGTIAVRYTAPKWCELNKTRDACQLRMILSVYYPRGFLPPLPMPLPAPDLIFYELAGAVEKTIESSVTNSTLRLGHREFSGNPLYNENYPNPYYAPVGHASCVCYETFIDAHDPDYLIVASTARGEFKPRLGNNTTGCGVSQCHGTLDNYYGTITFQGWRENRFEKTSILAITGGSGLYAHSKGFIRRSFLDSALCRSSRFTNRETTLSSCIAYIEVYFEKTPKTLEEECLSVLDGRGANMKLMTQAARSSRFGLGELIIVGSPLYDLNATVRMGYSVGYYYKTYLDSRIDGEAYMTRWNRPGAHTRALMWGGRGLHEGLLSLYTSASDSLVIAGSFEEAILYPNNYAVVGGTGRFANARGSILGMQLNKDDGALCELNDYRNASATALDCVYLLEICFVK